ncbi:hypothetical protein JNUCC83_11965 [Vagococcus sp. JNUCC 83]
MKNMFNKNKQFTLNAILLLLAIILLSLSIIFYFIGLFGSPHLENFFGDISSLFFIGFVGFGLIYLVKMIVTMLTPSDK